MNARMAEVYAEKYRQGLIIGGADSFSVLCDCGHDGRLDKRQGYVCTACGNVPSIKAQTESRKRHDESS